jgi:hypothetical protein
MDEDEREPMTERRHGLRALGTALPALTKRALGRRGFAEGGLALDWASIVGEEIAANTLPLKVSYPRGARLGGTLHLKVTSGYALVISHCEPQLLERVNAYLGYGAVERLKLMHGHRAEPLMKPESPDDSEPAPMVSGVENAELAAALASFGKALRQRRR